MIVSLILFYSCPFLLLCLKKVYFTLNRFLDFCTIKICYLISIFLLKRYQLSYESFSVKFNKVFCFLKHSKETTMSPYYGNLRFENKHYCIRITFRLCLDSCYQDQDKAIRIICYKNALVNANPIFQKTF